jgi:hypothetical protein
MGRPRPRCTDLLGHPWHSVAQNCVHKTACVRVRGVAHTVTADDGSWGSSTLGQGATYSQVFTSPGTYTYHCAIHPSMKGTVVVT